MIENKLNQYVVGVQFSVTTQLVDDAIETSGQSCVVEVPCPRCLAVPSLACHQFAASQLDSAALLGASTLTCANRHVVRIADLSPTGVSGRSKLQVLADSDIVVERELGLVNE
jgi:hypothetical protein